MSTFYKVHLYLEVRCPMIVEAESYEDAILKALDSDLNRFVATGECDSESLEFAEEIHGALVDVVGDEEYEQSKSFTGEEVLSIEKKALKEKNNNGHN